MKPEIKIKRTIKKFFDTKICDGFSIWKDRTSDIWYLIGFDINKSPFILSKAESGTTVERVKKLFPGYDFSLKENEWNNVEFFPGFNQSVNVMFMKEGNSALSVPGIGGMYEFN